ncbi:MAG: hypothetical protein AABY18_07380 [Candidatus Thermoplasmatota archaeon]
MAAKDWLVPLLLAGATFGLLTAFDPTGNGQDADAAGHAGFVLAFDDVRVAPRQVATQVVLLADGAQQTGTGTPWVTPHVALSWSVHNPDACDPRWPCVVHDEATDGEPRLGLLGYNATRVTVHVFDVRGELVFSNGNASEQARLTRQYAPEQLPAGTWYLGSNNTLPPGTQRLPPAAAAFLGQVRDLIQGLPVGGVVSIETEALATWYGTLFVTLQVDDLVHAP